MGETAVGVDNSCVRCQLENDKVTSSRALRSA